MSNHVVLLTTVAGSVATVAGTGLGVWAYARPSMKRRAAADQAILGIEEVRDLGGGITTIGQPGLVHVTRENSARLEKVEKAVTTLAQVLANQKELSARDAEHEHRITKLEVTAADHESTLAALIATKFETGAKAALIAVEKTQRGAIDVEPEDGA